MIGFDDMISGMFNNKKLNLVITELFIRDRKLNISFIFITKSYFAVSNILKLNSTHYFIMKVPNRRELQQIAFNHSSDIGFEDFVNLYKKYTLQKIFTKIEKDEYLTGEEILPPD